MKKKPCPYPFEGLYYYEPILDAKQNRRLVVLVGKTATEFRTTMSYARYLMSCHLQRWLHEDETVDHIDNNSLNDDIANLQLLSLYKNIKKQKALVVKPKIKLVCPSCSKDFERSTKGYHKKTMRKFCSRSCSTKFYKTINKEK